MLWMVEAGNAQDQVLGYEEIFGEDFLRAEHYLSDNAWMADTLTAHGLDPCVVLAVIFPELIRYSSIRDYMEVRGLEVLYIQYGTDYADFSIGHFQMKPSFAESIEEDIPDLMPQPEIPVPVNQVSADSGGVSIRRERLLRLQCAHGQLMYLEAFFRIVGELYPAWDSLTPERKVQYYASAYQGGYRRGHERIEAMVHEKYFHTGLPVGATKYSYADISLFYYRRCK